MISLRRLVFRASIVAALGVGACANYDTRLTNSSVKYLGVGETVVDPSAKEDLALRKSYWDGDGISGAPSIVINLTKQTASFYK